MNEDEGLAAKWWVLIIGAPLIIIAVAAWWILKPPTVVSVVSPPIADPAPVVQPPIAVAQPPQPPPAPEPQVAHEPSPADVANSFKGFADRFVAALPTTEQKSPNSSGVPGIEKFSKTSVDVERSPSILHPFVGKLGVKWLNVQALTDMAGVGIRTQMTLTFGLESDGTWSLIEGHTRVEKSIGGTTGGARMEDTSHEETDNSASPWMLRTVEVANAK
jgi:hypothetical protein